MNMFMSAPSVIGQRARPAQQVQQPSKASPQSPAVAIKTPLRPRQTAATNQNVKLKVVIRGLPPNLPEEKFKETTSTWINPGTVEWYYYVTGKLHEGYIAL
jgi:Smg-4/UPF3 family